MLTPTEREAINDEVEQGTFDLENALDDIATEQKGEGVRRAIYGGIMLANKNGAGGPDLSARNRIADANGRIDAIESEMAQFIASHTGVVEGTRIVEDVLWTGNLYNSNDVAGLYAEIQGYDIRTYDYLDLYIKHAGKELIYRATPNALLSDGIQLSETNLTNDTWTTELPLYASEYNLKATMFDDTWYSVEVDISVWEWSGKAAEASNQFANTSPTRALTKIVGIKHQAVDASKDSELTDMRVGEDGTVYASAGQALRAQIAQVGQSIDDASEAASAQIQENTDDIDQLKSDLGIRETSYSNFIADDATHSYITKRQFYSYIIPKHSHIIKASIPVTGIGGGAVLKAEVWEIGTDGNTLTKVKTVNITPNANTINDILIDYLTLQTRCYVAIYMYNIQVYNVSDSTDKVIYDSTNNADAMTLQLSSLSTTTGKAMTGGVDYTVSDFPYDEAYRLPVKWRQGTMSNGNAYFTLYGCVTDYMIPTAICDEIIPLANTHTLSVNYYDYNDGVYSFYNRVQFTGNHTIDKTHDFFVVNIFKSWSEQTLISECDGIVALYVTLPFTEFTKSIVSTGYHYVPQFNTKDIWSMAHQGYSADGANHNKKGGYARAASRGFTHGECDVQLTSDNVPVCCHDATFTDQTTSEVITISTKTYAELITYNYYGGTIASLEEIITECKQCGLQLEIDQVSTSNVFNITDVVSKMSAWGICTFAIYWMNEYPTLAPGLADAIKSVNANAKILVGFNGFTNFDNAIAFVKTLDNAVFAVGQYTNSNLNTLKTMASALEGGARLHIWTVDVIGDIKNALPYINGWTSNAISGDDVLNPTKGCGLNL